MDGSHGDGARDARSRRGGRELRDGRRALGPAIEALLARMDLAAGRLAELLAGSMRPRPRVLGYLVHAEDFPMPLALHRRGFLRPPPQFDSANWVRYDLDVAEERRKTSLLQVYRSQRRDPFLRLLLDAFLRRNELFAVE